MGIECIMNINANTLHAAQFRELKKFAVHRLRKITTLIEIDQYDDAFTLLSGSPAGDGYGEDNSYIDFSIEGTDIEDISDVLNKLTELKSFL